MRLEDWLQQHQKTQAWLAERVCVDQATISRLIAREGKKQVRKPSWDLAGRIRIATDGAVTELDWADIEPDPEPAHAHPQDTCA